MKFASACLAILLASAFAIPAKAEGSATLFVGKVKSGDPIYSAMLGAWGYGMSTANAKLEHDGKEPLFCIPPKLALTDQQYGNILDNFVQDNPELANMPAAIVLIYALESTFPCG